MLRVYIAETITNLIGSLIEYWYIKFNLLN